MDWVLIVGLLINAIAAADRRAPGGLALPPDHQRPARPAAGSRASRLASARPSKTQLVEVFAQRKLLKWTVPGAAHLFVFWAFLILATVYVEAYGVLLISDEFAIPLIGHWEVLGFAQDLIAVLALVSLGVFAQIRLKNAPEKLGRRSRFSGSHLGGAWMVLFMIFNVIWTMFLFRGAASAAGNLPYDSGAFVSVGLGNLLDGLSEDAIHVLEGIGLLLHIGVMLVFLVIVLNSKHLHIFVAPLNVHVQAAAGRARRRAPADLRRQAGHPRRPRGHGRGHHARHRLDRGLLVEGHARHRDLHRVRPLPGPVPGVEHREAALAPRC